MEEKFIKEELVDAVSNYIKYNGPCSIEKQQYGLDWQRIYSIRPNSKETILNIVKQLSEITGDSADKLMKIIKEAVEFYKAPEKYPTLENSGLFCCGCGASSRILFIEDEHEQETCCGMQKIVFCRDCILNKKPIKYCPICERKYLKPIKTYEEAESAILNASKAVCFQLEGTLLGKRVRNPEIIFKLGKEILAHGSRINCKSASVFGGSCACISHPTYHTYTTKIERAELSEFLKANFTQIEEYPIFIEID